MILFPHAKINLGLNVLARRQDGYHDIESIMVPIPLHDVLEAVVAPELGTNGFEYTRSGLPIPGAAEHDLCYKAVRALQAIQELPGLRLHLHKVVPMGAGLGGGSSDGAHTLLLVNALCELGLSQGTLARIALELGSDCPFFLQNKACAVRGRGEVLKTLDLDLKGLWLILANPGIHVSTVEVYRNTETTGRPWALEELAQRSTISAWHSSLPNTMEPYVLKTHPAVVALKQTMLDLGASYAAMSGSGSSVFGLFTREPELPTFPAGTIAWKLQL